MFFFPKPKWLGGLITIDTMSLLTTQSNSDSVAEAGRSSGVEKQCKDPDVDTYAAGLWKS